IGEIQRLSGPPRVASHQTKTTTPIAATPARRRVIGGGESRSVSSDGFEVGSATIYLGAAVASAGYTLTSTRAFFAPLSGSVGSAGLSQPMPTVENWFGCSDPNFLTIASFTELARFSDSSWTMLFGTWPRIEASVCPSMTMRAAPYWPASLPTS